jgi:hypothetical protein
MWGKEAQNKPEKRRKKKLIKVKTEMNEIGNELGTRDSLL